MGADILFPPASGAPRRKNGRQQACEPCRRRKVACDHRLPICSRCKRGRNAQKCVYLVQGRSIQSLSPPPSTSTSSALVPTPESGALASTNTPVADGNTGYLGATSFSAIYLESPQEGPLSGQDPCIRLPDGNGTTRAATSQALVDLAMQALRSVPDQATAEALMQAESSVHDGWCRAVGERLHESFWATFAPQLKGSRGNEPLGQMVSEISENTSRPFNDDHVHPDDWFKAFSGSRLRWESLGHLFIYWAYGARSITEACAQNNPECHDLRSNDLLDLVRRYKLCASWCIELSRAATSGNTLMTFLVYKHCLLESQATGETGMPFWKAHGDVISLATFLGLHSPQNTDEDDISIGAQMGRRIMAAVFCHDKTVSTFTGRPPFLSRRFVSSPLPLDISDHDLLSGAKLKGTASQHFGLDRNGWNTQGEIFGSTLHRARFMLALIRDEILEVALQRHQYNDTNNLADLKMREMEVFGSFPPAIIFHKDDIKSKSPWSKRILTYKLRVKLEHLQNVFLIERLLRKNEECDRRHGHNCSSELVDVGLDLISHVLLIWTHQRALEYPEHCLDWMVLCYGAPAGGVLCLQLLEGRFDTKTKVKIIEHLNMLVGFFDWVSPSAPNYALCKSVRGALRCSIERSLAVPTMQPAERAADTNAMVDVMENWDMEAVPDLDGMFNLDLLDTFDWLRPEAAPPVRV